MDIAAIKTRLASIQGAITGVKRAYTHGPAGLPESDLPIFANFTGPANNNFEAYGDGERGESRDMIMRLYVLPIQSGIDGEAEKKVEPFIDLVYAAFDARPGLSSPASPQPLATIQGAFIVSDSGVTVMRYGSGEAAPIFIGVEFRLRVSAAVAISYAKFE